MVMGEDSCSKGHKFESQYPILDGQFPDYLLSTSCASQLTQLQPLFEPFISLTYYRIQKNWTDTT